MRTTFEHEGDIRGTDLLAGLVALWREGASGSLQFSRSGATAGFELSRGELAATSSSDPRFETASILVRAGKLEAATLERLAAPEGGDRALLALQAGLLTRREWRWGEKIRAVEILSDLLTWLDGEFWFFRTTEGEAPDTRLPIPRLILELFLRSRDRSLVLHYLGGVDVPIARAETFDEEFATFGLTADAESVVRLIDGKSSAAEIASEAPAEPFAVEKLLAALVTLGLVHPEFGPGAARPAAPGRVPESEGGEDAHEQVEASVEPEPDDAEAEDAAPVPRPGPVDLELDEPGGASYDDEPEFRDGEMEAEPVATEMTDAPLDGDFREDDLAIAPEEGGGRDAYSARDEFEPVASGSDPSFEGPLDATTGIGSVDRPRQRQGSPLVWTLGVLAVVVAGLIWVRSRGPVAPAPAAARPEATATATPAPGPAPAGQPVAETQALIATVPPRALATPSPRAEPTRPRGTGAATGRTEAAGAANSTSRQYWMDRATRDEKRFATGARARYAIQLELACEIGSLVDAFRHDRGGNMWLVTTSFQGRTCFRVLWGHYSTPEAGRRALPGAPSFFSTPRNHPAVTAVR